MHTAIYASPQHQADILVATSQTKISPSFSSILYQKNRFYAFTFSIESISITLFAQMDRQRSFDYFKNLPYQTEDEADGVRALENCVGKLHIAVATKQYRRADSLLRRISNLLHLKFKLPRDTHLKLVRLCFELGLAQGLDMGYARNFQAMFVALAK